MHKSSYCLSLVAVYLEDNFQTGLAPLSLQFPPNPSGFVNLFSIPHGFGSDGNGLRLHWGVLVDNRTQSRIILQNRRLNVVRKGFEFMTLVNS